MLATRSSHCRSARWAVWLWLAAAPALAETPGPAIGAPPAGPEPRTRLHWNLESALKPPTGAVLLAPVRVTGRRDAFGEADQRLRKTMDALPCSGCDAKAETQDGRVERILDGVGAVLKGAFVAAEDAGDQPSIEDRAQQQAEDRRFIRDGQP